MDCAIACAIVVLSQACQQSSYVCSCLMVTPCCISTACVSLLGLHMMYIHVYIPQPHPTPQPTSTFENTQSLPLNHHPPQAASGRLNVLEERYETMNTRIREYESTLESVVPRHQELVRLTEESKCDDDRHGWCDWCDWCDWRLIHCGEVHTAL